MNSTDSPSGKPLIVLIDDEPSVLLALRLLLGAIGFRVRDFAKSVEAAEYLKGGGDCDIVLSDLRMPELDGIGVLREVKSVRPELPFILISGHATQDDVRKAEAFGVNGFLSKPFTPDQLRETLTPFTGK